jgi:hypothetical protein
LALPNDPAESFVREVDENLRRDQLRDMAKSHGKWLVAAVILLLVAVGGYLFWQDRQRQQVAEQSEALSGAIDKIGEGNVKGATADLAPLSDASNDVVRASSELARAAIALRQNDRKAALDIYKRIAADNGMPQPYRDLATVRGTMVEYDQLKPDEIIARLSPLAEPGKPFFGTAGEMVALATLAKGDRNGAGQIFARIAEDRQVPESIRSRAIQFAGSLGVDATAALPAEPAANPAQ